MKHMLTAGLILTTAVPAAHTQELDFGGSFSAEFFSRATVSDVNHCLAELELAAMGNRLARAPLHPAAHGGNAEAVNLLLDQGSEIGAKDKNGMTPLHLAAGFSNSSAMVALLVDRGGRPVVRDSDGRTPLHWPAGSSGPEVVGLLLDQGADIAAKDNNGGITLHWAAANSNSPEVVDLLLVRGADIATMDNSG